MRLLLDTHVVVWLGEGMAELGDASRAMIDAAAASHGLAVSAVSFWEVAMLETKGRVSLSQPIGQWAAAVATVPGLIEAPVTSAVGIEAARLPGEFHGDPADRMIVATARLEGWRLATRDSRVLAYGEAGHVNVAKI